MPEWMTIAATIATVIGSLVTAIATFFLWRVTRTLAVETRRLVQLGSQPHVVATIEPNQWAEMLHCDLRVENTGNATAYDIRIVFDPPLRGGSLRAAEELIPFQKLSVMRPGQFITSYLGELHPLLDEVRNVSVSWRRDASKDATETNKYSLDLGGLKGRSRLGEANPLMQIADQVKKLREDWQDVAKGRRRLKVDVLSAADRTRENAERAAWISEAKRESRNEPSANPAEVIPSLGGPEDLGK